MINAGPYSGDHFDALYLPARYPSNEAFVGVFGADLDATRALLPSDTLFPVRLRRGRAAIVVSAMYFPYDITTDVRGSAITGPAYGEMSISVPCTRGRAAPPFVPLANLPLGDAWRMEMFVAHLPVTSIEAWEAGRLIWNAPKFVADMDFDLGPELCAASLAEGGREILRLETPRGGLTRRDRNDLVWYASKDGQLLRTVCRVDGIQQIRLGTRAGSLRLGDHAIADELRALDVDTAATAAQTYLRHSMVLPSPEVVGTAKPHDGLLRKTEKRRGRLVLHYPNVAPIDVYAVAHDATGRVEPTESVPTSGSKTRARAAS